MTAAGTPRLVLDGLVFPEVPRWKDGELWLCDFQVWLRGAKGQVLVVGRDGTARVVVDQVPGGPPTGLAWLPEGRLLIAASSGRQLLALEPDGGLSCYADLSGVVSHGLNELAVDSRGRVYVGSARVPPDPQLMTELAVVHPEGRVEVVDSSLRFPNGLLITPDGRTLIVAESTGHCLSAFAIGDDGSLRDKRVWASLPGMVPDGPCLDQEGCVWVADAVGKACVRVAEGGEIRNRVRLDQDAFACTLGGREGRTLFITTSVNPFTQPAGASPANLRTGKVVAVDVEVPGPGQP